MEQFQVLPDDLLASLLGSSFPLLVRAGELTNDGGAETQPVERRLYVAVPGNPQLPRVRRPRPARLRHRPRPPVRQADPHRRARTPRACPNNVKGICASARTRTRLHQHDPAAHVPRPGDREAALGADLRGGCDRMSITPDGQLIYLPSLEGPFWNVVDAARTARSSPRSSPNSASHNTIFGLDGDEAYLAGLHSPLPDRRRHQRRTRSSAPSARSRSSIRPFTVNGRQTLCFVNVNDLLGFEVGDLTTGQKLHRVEVAGLRERPDQAARLPEPRHRPDARREGALGHRRPQQPAAHLRRHRDAARSRSRASCSRTSRAGSPSSIDGQLRLSLDRRRDRRQDAEDRRRAEGRDRPRRPEREAARDRLPGRPSRSGRATSSGSGGSQPGWVK